MHKDIFELGDGTYVAAEQIDVFAAPDEATAMTWLEVLGRYAAMQEAPEMRTLYTAKAERLAGLINTRWPAPALVGKIKHIKNRERQWVSMLRKLSCAVLKPDNDTESRQLARRYYTAINNTQMED